MAEKRKRTVVELVCDDRRHKPKVARVSEYYTLDDLSSSQVLWRHILPPRTRPQGRANVRRNPIKCKLCGDGIAEPQHIGRALTSAAIEGDTRIITLTDLRRLAATSE